MVAQLQTALDQREKELVAQYEKRLSFQKKNPTLVLGNDRSNAVIDRLNELSSALTRAELERIDLEGTYKATQGMMDDPQKIAQLMSAPSFRGGDNAQLRHELRTVQQQFQSLSSNYGLAYSGLQSLQANIKRMSDDLAAEDKRAAQAYLAELESKLVASKQREATIKEKLNLQQSEVLALNSTAAEFGLIEAEIRRLERSSDSLDQRLKELKVTEDMSKTYNITVLENARPGGPPVEPDRAMTMFMSLAIGLMAGVGVALLREFTDQRLRSADEIKHVIGLPILGVVPHIIHARTASQRGLQLHLDPMSDVAEAYRTVRTAVYFGVPAGLAKTLLITSPAPGDGKTTLASNLAVAMAQAGNRILLLDADFRKPMQHKIFEIESKLGLSSVLAGEVTLEQAIHHSAIPGLDVLPCGPIPANPSEILNSQTFADLLDEMSARYDHVLLDSPPVMPVTDSRILAASCDATVRALRAEKTTRRGAVYARDVLRAVGSRILGVVVNDVPRRKGVYGYYYSDADAYTYGYSNRGKPPTNGAAKALPRPALVEEAPAKEAI
jgi:capsular exopolysaccharide synthesis family protein